MMAKLTIQDGWMDEYRFFFLDDEDDGNDDKVYERSSALKFFNE